MVRAAIRATAATILLAVVGIAIRRHPFHWRTTSKGSLVHANTVATDVAIGLTAIGLLVVIASFALRGGPHPVAPKRPTWRNDLVALAFLLAFIALAPRLHLSGCSAHLRSATATIHPKPTQDVATPVHHGRPASAALVLILLLVVAGVALVLSTRRHSGDGATLNADHLDVPFASGLLGGVADGLDAAALDPDPRRAIVAAFARMEANLAAHGLARRPNETAVEFMQRVLMDAAAPRPSVAGLCGLFEEARYSTHPLGPTDRSTAITHLTTIREALA